MADLESDSKSAIMIKRRKRYGLYFAALEGRLRKYAVLDQVSGKKRGMGAVICNCSDIGMLRENVLQMPVWYI